VPTVGTTHNIELGGRYYMLKPGSYMKRSAPQFGARFSTGDPDFNNLSPWQHWAQRCFVGGMDAEQYADDAMFDDGVGVDTTFHEQVTLSRDLRRGTGSNWTVGGTSRKRKFVVYNNLLYCLTLPDFGTASVLWKYDSSTDGWTSIKTWADLCARAVAVFDGKLFVLGRKLDNSAARIEHSSGALGAWTSLSLPSGTGTASVDGAGVFQQKLYVAFGTLIWRLKDDLTWDGSTVFYKANAQSDSNKVVAMTTHLGFLYMLSANGHVHRTDGNTTFDIWNWDGGTQGVAIKSFDGRLFIATFEYTQANVEGFGALYQMSGSAVTQLKRWGIDGQVTTLGSLTVYDRKLFYGASNLFGMRVGVGIACYDPIEDAHSIVACSGDATLTAGAAPYAALSVDDVFAWGGYMWISVRDHGILRTPYRYRDYIRNTRSYDITGAGGSASSLNGGWFTTSTYDAGTPGVKKLWRKVIVDYTIPSSSQQIIVDYSLDNGGTWTTLATITTVGTRVRAEYFLENKIATSLKLRFTLRSTNLTQTPTFFGFVVSYLPVPEPNWIWTFTIVMSEKQVLVDGTEETNDTEEELEFLRTAFRTKQLLHFTDIDSTSWATGGQPGVLIYDIEFRLYDPSSQPLEGDVIVTLLEAVETY
jgi:hypothetical protein